mmetsp:Transcript_23850/g.70627  ORF Transcript_23850/g.70627 Transcript_23850/m.70627 type:complete len:236 (-) Transcript_23850:451-1158(-)
MWCASVALRRHVGGRPLHRPRDGVRPFARRAKVANLGRAPGVEDHVLELQVAVRDVLAVQVADPLHDLRKDGARLRFTQSAPRRHVLAKVPARGVLHLELGPALAMHGAARRDDVAVSQLARKARLVAQMMGDIVVLLRLAVVVDLDRHRLTHRVGLEAHPCEDALPEELWRRIAPSLSLQCSPRRAAAWRGRGAWRRLLWLCVGGCIGSRRLRWSRRRLRRWRRLRRRLRRWRR